MNRIKHGCVFAVALVALAGCGSSDDEASPTATDTTETTTTETTTTETTTTETTPPPPAPTTIRIAVRDGRPVGGIARPSVEQGERVVLVVSADVSGGAHLHGYDLQRPVRPGRPARIRFRATIPGRFEIELHAHPELQIGELTVRP
jgi:hypothetical protein